MIPANDHRVTVAKRIVVSICFAHSEPHCWLCADIAALRPIVATVAFIHGEPARHDSHNPQHFGADVGRVGDLSGEISFHAAEQ